MSEKIVVLWQDDRIKIEKIYSFGESSPLDFWYDSDFDEWVTVIVGEAEILLHDGQLIKLKSGDQTFLTKNLKHRVHYTSSNCEWLSVYIFS